MRPAQPSVLVVDDVSDVRGVISGALSDAGFDVTPASDAAEAIALLNASAFDAIVVALRLPDAGAMHVLDLALARHPGAPSLLVAGLAEVGEAMTAVNRGGFDFVVEPFQLARIPAVLCAEFERRRLRQENTELRAQLAIVADQQASPHPPVRIPDEGIHFTSVVSHLERELILRCLEKTGGNKRQAARLLHLSRTTLIDKIHRLVSSSGASSAL